MLHILVSDLGLGVRGEGELGKNLGGVVPLEL